MGVSWALLLVALLVRSVAVPLCTDMRFLVDILDEQRPLYGYRHLLIAHDKDPPRNVLCREELIRLHGNYTVVVHAGADAEKEMSVPAKLRLKCVTICKNGSGVDLCLDNGFKLQQKRIVSVCRVFDIYARNVKQPLLEPWHQIHVDLVVLLTATVELELMNTMFGVGGAMLVPFKHITPILVIYTTELEPGGDPYGRADVETIVLALRAVGWMHTAIAVQKYDGARLGKVPVYLSRPGFEPGSRCGLGPSTTTLEFVWTAAQTLAADVVGGLKPRRPYPLNGCDVHVAPLPDPPYVFADLDGGFRGADIDLVDYFAADKNATVHLVSLTLASTNSFRLVGLESQIQVHPEPPALEDKDKIYQAFKKYDVVVGGLFPTIERYKFFDLSAPYAQDVVYGFVTARLPVDAWQYPFVVLSPQVWVAMCGVMLLLVLVLSAMGRGGFESIIILLGVLFDSEPNPKLGSVPKQTVFLIFLWTVFCMHFNSGYRASLAMAFINHISQPGPSTIRDVKRVGFLYGVSTHLLTEGNQDTRRFSPRLEICNNVSNCSVQIKSDPENMGLVMSEVSMWFATPRYFMDHQLKSLLKRSERMATFFLTFLVQKGSLLREPLDDALVKTREFGLNVRTFNNIERNLTRIMGRNYRERLKTVDRNGFFLVFGVCCLLLAGLALATLVFCGELVHHRLSRGRANLRLDIPRTGPQGAVWTNICKEHSSRL